MKNFDWTTFTRKIAVRSSMEKLYDAWTKSSAIETWFLSNANYFDANKQGVGKDTAVEKDFTYEWSWHCYDIVEKGTITRANGKDHLQFTFAGDCLVDISLDAQGDDVIVSLTQTNIPTDDESKQNIRLGCASGWAFYLVNLKSVYETGYDLRNKNVEWKGMVNS